MLSVLLALSMWKAFGVSEHESLRPSQALVSSDEPEEEQPVRLAADVELKEDNKSSDSVDEIGLLLGRELLAPVSRTKVRWQIEVRSLVSQRVRVGHGARGPPLA
jgi:hypothetical protein